MVLNGKKGVIKVSMLIINRFTSNYEIWLLFIRFHPQAKSNRLHQDQHSWRIWLAKSAGVQMVTLTLVSVSYSSQELYVRGKLKFPLRDLGFGLE